MTTHTVSLLSNTMAAQQIRMHSMNRRIQCCQNTILKLSTAVKELQELVPMTVIWLPHTAMNTKSNCCLCHSDTNMVVLLIRDSTQVSTADSAAVWLLKPCCTHATQTARHTVAAHWKLPCYCFTAQSEHTNKVTVAKQLPQVLLSCCTLKPTWMMTGLQVPTGQP